MAELGTRTLVISIGGTDFTTQVSDCRVTSKAAGSGFVSFAAALAGGGREYTLEFKAVQDLVAGTLWDKIFTAPGTSAAILIKPYGGAVASPTNPHFTANATITEPDGDLLGGEADADTTARMTFEAKWVLAGKPVRVIA